MNRLVLPMLGAIGIALMLGGCSAPAGLAVFQREAVARDQLPAEAASAENPKLENSRLLRGGGKSIKTCWLTAAKRPRGSGRTANGYRGGRPGRGGPSWSDRRRAPSWCGRFNCHRCPIA